MGFDRRRSRDSSQSDESDTDGWDRGRYGSNRGSDTDGWDRGRYGSNRENDTDIWGQDSSRSSQSSDDDLPGPNPTVPGGFERAEEHYGREFKSTDKIRHLRRLESTHGEKVHEWLDEGMPPGAMGDLTDMEAYRERKGTPIPWDIEHQNKDSKEWNKSEVARKMRETPDGYARVTDSVRDVLSSPGRPLDEPIQRAMEERMGDSFGDVQIHAGPKAAEAAEQINARAFTVGNHIAFNHGEYDPESAEGQRVIAHELAHVRQQTGGALSMLPQEDLQLEIDPDPELEREAEETAERVMSGGELDIQRLPLRYADVHVQRMGVPPSVGGVSDAVAGAKEKAGSVKDTVSEAVSGVTDDSSNETSDSAVTMPADVEVLAEEVAQLRKDVNELQSPDSAAKKIGVEAGKGTMGAVGGAVGGTLGTAIAPGVGTAAGGAIGTVVGGALGGTMGAVYERNFDEGVDFLNQEADDAVGFIKSVVDKKIKSVLGESVTDSDDSQGLV